MSFFPTRGPQKANGGEATNPGAALEEVAAFGHSRNKPSRTFNARAKTTPKPLNPEIKN